MLTASLAARDGWAASGTNATCVEAVREGAAEAGPKTYTIKPAVVAATFGSHVLADTYTNSSGFPHVLSMHSARVVATVHVLGNFATSSVVRLIDATVSVFNTTLNSNQVGSGSVVLGDSCRGHFEEVSVGGSNRFKV